MRSYVTLVNGCKSFFGSARKFYGWVPGCCLPYIYIIMSMLVEFKITVFFNNIPGSFSVTTYSVYHLYYDFAFCFHTQVNTFSPHMIIIALLSKFTFILKRCQNVALQLYTCTLISAQELLLPPPIPPLPWTEGSRVTISPFPSVQG